MRILLIVLLAGALAAGCGRNSSAPRSGAPPASTVASSSSSAARSAQASSTQHAPREAAASHILIMYKNSLDHLPGITRTREEARELAYKVAAVARQPGADFEALARQYSDDPTAQQSGGYIGIFREGSLALAFEQQVFALQVGEVSNIVETDYGFHIIKRMPVQRVHAHHILIAWRGAERASAAVTRTRPQAAALAEEVRVQAARPGADLCKLARQFSDDTQNSADCGDLGIVEPGQLPPEADAEIFHLHAGQVSPVVETPYGLHIFWRE
jgi:peptidyl-prolyl cis-trans isomerase SurA